MKLKLLAVLVLWLLAGPSPAAAQDAGDAAQTSAIVYVSNAGGGITEVNTENNSVIATAPFPNNANGVVVTPNGRRIYATNRDVPEVTVFDAGTNVPLTVIPVGNGTQDTLGVAISPDGELVYVANQVSGTVTVIHTETNKVIQEIPTGIDEYWGVVSRPKGGALMSLLSIENLTALETLATIICESGGGHFLRIERVKGRPALVLFRTANILDESQSPIAIPITEFSTLSVRNCLLALERPDSEEAR